MTRLMISRRTFVLSPAHCGGKRAGYLFDDRARFPLAQRIRSEGVTLGEAFSFLSGLYFRGKLAYAMKHTRPHDADVLVITANRGLLPAATVVGVDDLRAFGAVDIRHHDPRYREPLEHDVGTLARTDGEVVLLGSVATPKYVDVLLAALGDRLLFPAEFAGLGDMSRGALLLRAVRDERELEHIPVAGALLRSRS